MYCLLTSRQKLLYQGIKNKISIEDLLQSSTTGTDKAGSAASSLMNLVMQFRKVHLLFKPCMNTFIRQGRAQAKKSNNKKIKDVKNKIKDV